MSENQKDQPMIPRMMAEKTILHLGYANKRMLIALLAVCITFILTIVIFVFGYTIREKNWMDMVVEMQKTPAVTEVAADGTATE